jgi:hypothetical protein
MALERQDVKKLLQFRRQFTGGAAALILGDCHLHFSRGYLAELAPTAGLDNSSEGASLADVARALGFESLHTVDLFGKPTIRFDLHGGSPPQELVAKYDWVIDAGTAYCCFDVAAVLKNMLAFLKPDGCVYQHASLVGHLGRGYYSFSPMLFSDFYTQNGFEIIEMCVRVKPPSEARRSGVIAHVRRVLSAPAATSEDWQALGRHDFFVSSADRSHISFADRYRAPEPAALPNNSMVMCFARRQAAAEFRNAIPEFFNT